MWRLIYNGVLHTVAWAMRHGIAGQSWVDWWSSRSDFIIRQAAAADQKKILICCASLGEYESVRVLLDDMSAREQYHVHISFFSSSGFEAVREGGLWDVLSYQPLDLCDAHRDFRDRFDYDVVLIVANDVWFNFLRYLQEVKVPYIFLNTSLGYRQDYLHRIYYRLIKPYLQRASQVFVYATEAASFWEEQGLTNVKYLINLRNLAIQQRVNASFEDTRIADFANGHKLLIAGSTHPSDERLIFAWMTSYVGEDWRVLVVPHEVTQSHLEAINAQCPWTITTHSSKSPPDDSARVMLLDTMGILKYVYRYADKVFIGGGFDKGIHNSMEAAMYGKPIAFGPKYQKFPEAVQLVIAHRAQVVTSVQDLTRFLNT